MALSWLVATVARSRNEKNTRVRYIAGPPAALRGTQPSQTIMLVKPSASGASAARAPDMCSDCRASISSAHARGDGLREAWGRQLFSGEWYELCCAHTLRWCVRSASHTVATARAVIPRLQTMRRSRSRTARKQMIKVVGRAGGRCGHGRCWHDGRAQPCAAWAMPRPVERAPASDGADGSTLFFRLRPRLSDRQTAFRMDAPCRSCAS